METFYYALADADDRLTQKHHINMHMDCEGGLKKLGCQISKPSETMDTDMDIVMAFNQLQKETKHDITKEWVMGHAKEKKKRRGSYRIRVGERRL